MYVFIWRNLYGNNDTIAYEPWPTYDEAKTVDLEIEMAVQVNGKLRGKIEVSTNTTKEEIGLLMTKAKKGDALDE